ncbi:MULTISPECIES: GNAT family N-acetyltransferase [unclassified Novosphingobium]|uniref:GNAT family N-acetyltransferase n=1 Tax=unclassified Novosphingobium TaxID=2644732 RepID=UPI001469DA9B|nr:MULTISPECIES: GNAT family N-acetyltransferase [unclassified Novosphingobium]NMN06610.1 GNAT superfamily N-acetyltransferase [Novosphingobium sp. SG919]NMN88939.1 GNAT superfamily N-acetyltransferase [Novosphingobium sp. SG916]
MAIADVAAPLGQGFHALAPGDLAAVVTALDMREAPASLKRLVPEAEVPLQLVRWKAADPAKYRLLYRRVGAKWLWWSRLALDDAALAAIIHDPQVEIYAVADRAGVEVGMLELDFRKPGEAEIAFFGLIPGATGKGFGKWLMRRALQKAWSHDGVGRVWVHTCTLDGPSALPFYMAQGFAPYARFVEVFPDPRGLGLLGDEAPQVPVLGVG